jgi:arginyl-tRNA synthetase
VVLDYFQLNIAKRPHVGHLRSAVIGDALKRLLLASGYRAVSDTHVGDWGTQFGILLLAFREAGIDRVVIEGDPFDLLEDLYQKESQRIEEDPARRERAKGEFATLEQGDEERREIWQWMVDISMRQLEASALRLGLLPFEEHRGESVYEDAMPGIVAEALGKGVAIKKEDGAVVVDLTEEKLDEAVLIKSDGASTYLLRDLATIQYRKQQWNFFRNLYVVDVRQEHHFRQVFRVAELLGWEGIEESQHIALGRMSLPEGSMSSRKGNAISLEKVCNEARDRARAVIAEKNPELRDADAVAEAVGIGAVKYFDLSHHRKSDIVFRWEDALSFDGNTGPYLQYTHARFSSILRKLGVAEFHSVRIPGDAFLDEGERAILLVMLGFPDAVRSAIEDFAPSNLATYLHALASTANEFYHTHPIAKEADETKKSLRLALAVGVVLSLRNGLGMLGIATPEEM